MSTEMKNYNYEDFKAFMVQYEVLIPDLLDKSFNLEDRLAALKELLKQNSELLAAATKTHFIPKSSTETALPIAEVKVLLENSNELLNDILLSLEPRHKLQYR